MLAYEEIEYLGFKLLIETNSNVKGQGVGVVITL